MRNLALLVKAASAILLVTGQFQTTYGIRLRVHDFSTLKSQNKIANADEESPLDWANPTKIPRKDKYKATSAVAGAVLDGVANGAGPIKIAESVALAATMAFPEFGPLLGAIISLFFPHGPSIWDQLKPLVERLIKQEIKEALDVRDMANFKIKLDEFEQDLKAYQRANGRYKGYLDWTSSVTDQAELAELIASARSDTGHALQFVLRSSSDLIHHIFAVPPDQILNYLHYLGYLSTMHLAMLKTDFVDFSGSADKVAEYASLSSSSIDLALEEVVSACEDEIQCGDYNSTGPYVDSFGFSYHEVFFGCWQGGDHEKYSRVFAGNYYGKYPGSNSKTPSAYELRKGLYPKIYDHCQGEVDKWKEILPNPASLTKIASSIVVGRPFQLETVVGSCMSSEVNIYSRNNSISGAAHGGTCTCPDGRVYPVSTPDGCGSLACYNGISSTCSQISDFDRFRMQVVCDVGPPIIITAPCEDRQKYDQLNVRSSKQLFILDAKGQIHSYTQFSHCVTVSDTEEPIKGRLVLKPCLGIPEQIWHPEKVHDLQLDDQDEIGNKMYQHNKFVSALNSKYCLWHGWIGFSDPYFATEYNCNAFSHFTVRVHPISPTLMVGTAITRDCSGWRKDTENYWPKGQVEHSQLGAYFTNNFNKVMKFCREGDFADPMTCPSKNSIWRPCITPIYVASEGYNFIPKKGFKYFFADDIYQYPDANGYRTFPVGVSKRCDVNDYPSFTPASDKVTACWAVPDISTRCQTSLPEDLCPDGTFIDPALCDSPVCQKSEPINALNPPDFKSTSPGWFSTETGTLYFGTRGKYFATEVYAGEWACERFTFFNNDQNIATGTSYTNECYFIPSSDLQVHFG